jgi:hypothetical protein
MHGLSEDLDLDFLPGRRLTQVCLGEFQVQMRFDADVTIDVEGEFTLDGHRRAVADATVLSKLIGHVIGSVTKEGKGDLRLRFGEHVLILHDSNREYESYSIQSAHGSIVV